MLDILVGDIVTYCYILWDESLNSKHFITAAWRASYHSQPETKLKLGQNWQFSKIETFSILTSNQVQPSSLRDFFFKRDAPSKIVWAVIRVIFPISIYILACSLFSSAVLAMFAPLSAEVGLEIVLFWSSLQSYNDNLAAGYWQGCQPPDKS